MNTYIDRENVWHAHSRDHNRHELMRHIRMSHELICHVRMRSRECVAHTQVVVTPRETSDQEVRFERWNEKDSFI